jgi:hypothetical protein
MQQYNGRTIKNIMAMGYEDCVGKEKNKVITMGNIQELKNSWLRQS